MDCFYERWLQRPFLANGIRTSIPLNYTIGPTDGVASDLVNAIVVDTAGNLLVAKTMAFRIVQNIPAWQALSDHEKTLQAVNWATGLLLFATTFSAPSEARVVLRNRLVVRTDSELYRRLEVDTFREPDIMVGINAANAMLSDGDNSVLYDRYGDCLLLGAMYRKKHGVGDFNGMDMGYVALREKFSFVPINVVDTTIQDFMDKITSNMFEVVSDHTLIEFGPLIARNSPLPRTVGYGKYPIAGDELSAISLVELADEYKTYFDMTITVVQHAYSELARDGQVGQAAQLLVLSLEETPMLIANTRYFALKAWWKFVVSMSNEMRIISPRIDREDSALDFVSTILTWWQSLDVLDNRSLGETRKSTKDIKIALSNAFNAVKVYEPIDSDEEPYTFYIEEHNMGPEKFGRIEVE